MPASGALQYTLSTGLQNSATSGAGHYSFLGNRSNGNIVKEEKKKRD
jgi:hypothetical protein